MVCRTCAANSNSGLRDRAKADGWLPSLGYADPGELAGMCARIDEAAEGAGRRPADIRRMYNINGEFGSGRGPPGTSNGQTLDSCP